MRKDKRLQIGREMSWWPRDWLLTSRVWDHCCGKVTRFKFADSRGLREVSTCCPVALGTNHFSPNHRPQCQRRQILCWEFPRPSWKKMQTAA